MRFTALTCPSLPLRCYDFSDGHGWLMADVSIKCGTKEHVQAQFVAWVGIVCYPVGLIVINAGLLYAAQRAITSGPSTPLSRALEFLHSDYESAFFWWEVPVTYPSNPV